jgi:hypothetical protein
MLALPPERFLHRRHRSDIEREQVGVKTRGSRTTALYDQRDDEVAVDEVERILV